MKKMMAISLVLLLPLLTAWIYITKKEPLQKVTDYKIYYGEPSEEMIQNMKDFDMVIIEPHKYTKNDIEKIRENGTIVMGYLSVMELGSWNEAVLKGVQESDYLLVDNRKKYISKWDTYLMDLSSSHYRGLLFDDAHEHIMKKGMDGIFIDTSGDIDDYFHDRPLLKKKLREGYIQLLAALKKADPDLLILQNWGFDTYKQASKPYVNAIMWENFHSAALLNNEWGQNWINYFQTQKRLAVFTVAPDHESILYSKQLKFIPYRNNSSIYDEW